MEPGRSEERRVGKGSRWLWGPEQEEAVRRRPRANGDAIGALPPSYDGQGNHGVGGRLGRTTRTSCPASAGIAAIAASMRAARASVSSSFVQDTIPAWFGSSRWSL